MEFSLRIPKWTMIAGVLVVFAIIAVVITLLVRGSDDDDARPGASEATTESEEVVGGPGTYTILDPYSGAEVSLTIPAPKADPQLQEWEDHIAAMDFGLPEPLWAKVKIDNRDGYERFELDFPDAFTLTTQGGKQVALSGVSRFPGCVDRPNQCSEALYNADVQIYNEYVDAAKAVPGARTSTLAYTASTERPIDGVSPQDVSRVFLLSSLEPVEMFMPGQEPIAPESAEGANAPCPPGYVPVGSEGACAPAE